MDELELQELIAALKAGNKAMENLPAQIRAITSALLEGDDEKIRTALDELQAGSRAIEDAISRFPATQKFLHSRGLTHVRELNKKGRQELEAYLKKVLEIVTNKAG